MTLEWLQGLAPLALVLVIATWKPQLGLRWFRSAERALAQMARRRGSSILLVGLMSFTLSAIISLFVQMPYPCGHDEFSYLLAADTFAHGRLANPPHPLWIHFESFHIIQQPTYASKYPPAQGLILALGQVMTGNPLVGLWLSVALASATICWMLYAWLPPRWALLGGLLVAAHPTMLFWGQRFLGGGLAVCGGALLFGAVRRLLVQPRARDAWLMGLGIATLANTRLYEGLVLTLIALGLVALRLAREARRKVFILLAAMLALTTAWIGFYNWRVTGHALDLPYLAHEKVYGVAPPFFWLPPRPEPSYRHKALRDFHMNKELLNFKAQQSAAGILKAVWKKLYILADAAFPVFLLGFPLVALVFPALAIPALLRDRWMKLALVICGAFTLALLPETWMNAHYAAPLAGLVVALFVQSLRHLRTWWPGARLLVRVAMVLALFSIIPTIVHLASGNSLPAWPIERARLLDLLRQTGENHLIVVRYSQTHPPEEEWVYNEADIDGAAVVWARDIDAAQNRRLLEYFRGRKTWLLQPDTQPIQLIPYPETRD